MRERSFCERNAMCPNSSNGQHNFVLKPYVRPGDTVIVRVCVLCGQEG